MRYILKHKNFYFIKFDEGWPTWMTEISSAKRYKTKKEAIDENDKLFECLKYKCEIIEVE
jgi:hypothetical protein